MELMMDEPPAGEPAVVGPWRARNGPEVGAGGAPACHVGGEAQETAYGCQRRQPPGRCRQAEDEQRGHRSGLHCFAGECRR
eukprot:763535-Alexandrium_andersonii.AAC.1